MLRLKRVLVVVRNNELGFDLTERWPFTAPPELPPVTSRKQNLVSDFDITYRVPYSILWYQCLTRSTKVLGTVILGWQAAGCRISLQDICQVKLATMDSERHKDQLSIEFISIRSAPNAQWSEAVTSLGLNIVLRPDKWVGVFINFKNSKSNHASSPFRSRWRTPEISIRIAFNSQPDGFD